MSRDTGIIILAAGQGTRMRSSLPKVLHKLAGRPLLSHVIETASSCNPKDTIIVYGHGGDEVRRQLDDGELVWVEQEQQLGTGHAVQQAMEYIDRYENLLILYGDVPLLMPETCKHLVEVSENNEVGILTMILDNPQGYGRILRDEQAQVQAIREHKDASDEEISITEVNTGIMSVPAEYLKKWLASLENNNAQGEYYLTDIVELAVKDNVTVRAVVLDDPTEARGVNDRCQLADLERIYQQRQAEKLMHAGVTLADPGRLDIRGSLECGEDVSIDINTIFEGSVSIGEGSTIGANTVIRNTVIGKNVEVLENCVIENAVIGKYSRIGPFARIRPGTELADHVHVGNFVEIKKSDVGKGSKINHLSYVGDSSIGSNVNIGAGTITCNYDGANKYRTTIGNDVFIGSDTQLIAPVKVNDGATIGAGSTITSDAPAGKLTLSRSKQKTIDNWQRPVKK